MEIKEVKEVLLRWIRSCDRAEQIDGLEKSAPAIIDNLFSYSVSQLTIELTKAELQLSMDSQLLIINDAYETITR